MDTALKQLNQSGDQEDLETLQNILDDYKKRTLSSDSITFPSSDEESSEDESSEDEYDVDDFMNDEKKERRDTFDSGSSGSGSGIDKLPNILSKETSNIVFKKAKAIHAIRCHLKYLMNRDNVRNDKNILDKNNNETYLEC